MGAASAPTGVTPSGLTDRLFAWARRHEMFAAAGVFTVILLGFFYPMLMGQQISQQHILWAEWPWRAFTPPEMTAPINANEGDEAHTFNPLFQAARRDIRNGEIPLWNRHSYGGHVMLGDQQTALLFPLTWLGVIFPLDWAWGPMMLLKLLIAAMGVFAFARGIGIRPWGGIFAGTAFMLSAPMLGWLQWPHSTVFALCPWLFLATDRLTRSGSWKDFGWVSLVVGLSIFAGHPESAILNSLAAFAYAIAVMLADRRRRATALVGVRKILMFIGTQPMGLLIAGAATMPFYEAYVLSIEKIAHKYQATPWLDPWDLLLYLMPDLYGRPGKWPVVGRLDFLFTSTLVDFGVAALVFAALGAWRLRGSPPVRALLAVAVLGAILMFDIFPADHLMKIPPLNTVIVQRVYVYIALAGCVIAGAALMTLLKKPLSVRAAIGWTAIPFVLAVGFLGFQVVLGVTYGPRNIINDSAIVRLAAELVLTCVLLILIGRVQPRLASATAVLVCVIQLAYHTDLNIWLPPSQAHPPTPPSIKYMQSKQQYPGQFRTGTIRTGVELNLMQSNAVAMYNLESLEGHDPPIARRWVEFATKVLGQPGYLERLPGGPDPREKRHLNVIRAMNVRYYLTRPYATYSIPGFEEVYRGPDAVIYKDTLALPRSYVVPEIRKGPAQFQKMQLLSPRFNPRKTAYIPLGVKGPKGKVGPYRGARSEWISNRSMRINVPNGGAGWLVVGNPYSPEWKATVDGKEVPVYATNFAMMGIPLEPGSHEVVMTYSSEGFWLGVLMSAIGLMIIGLMIIGGRRGWKVRARVEKRVGRTLPIPEWAAGPGQHLTDEEVRDRANAGWYAKAVRRFRPDWEAKPPPPGDSVEMPEEGLEPPTRGL